jgi:hypothetical protein
MNPVARGRFASIAALVVLVFVGWVALRGYQFLSLPSFPPDFGPDPMQLELFALAGPIAVDCGRVRIRHNPSAATECVLNAFENKKAFLVRYDLRGIDSQVAVGLAGDLAGRAFGVAYDSQGWSDKGLHRPSVGNGDQHLITTPCPKPVKLRKTVNGQLTCFPPYPDTKP